MLFYEPGIILLSTQNLTLTRTRWLQVFQHLIRSYGQVSVEILPMLIPYFSEMTVSMTDHEDLAEAECVHEGNDDQDVSIHIHSDDEGMNRFIHEAVLKLPLHQDHG